MNVDPYRVEEYAKAFLAYVERMSSMPFESFASNPYLMDEEGYKPRVHRRGVDELRHWEWTLSAVGKGEILRRTIAAIEIPKNNLVQWQARYGDESRPHQPLYDAQQSIESCKITEDCLFRLFRTTETEQAFTDLLEIVGREYPLVAYLCFLKDCTRYLPIRPRTFERALARLGADFKASGRCSWDNYQSFNGLILEVKDLLDGLVPGSVSLIDAHSFAWMIERQMARDAAVPDLTEYENLSDTEREAVIKARIGQGDFREALLRYWGCCAVTGLADRRLLRASHIVPWSQGSVNERLNPYNGLLLCVSLDAAFDEHLISFLEDGQILISSRLDRADAEILGIRPDMRLREVDMRHVGFLERHRDRMKENEKR